MAGELRLLRGRNAYARGKRSEYLAAAFLLCKFYRILGLRVRNRAGEIDLIAKSPSGVICFVEVKARGGEAAALESLGPQQRRRIGEAAALWLAKKPPVRAVRFDLVLLAPGRLPRHCPDAWRNEIG